MSDRALTRRRVLATLGTLATATASAVARSDAQGTARPSAPSSSSSAGHLAPRAELVNTLEFEEQARQALGPTAFAPLAGGDRHVFERITLRPRVMVPTTDLDLSLSLFGQTMFAPVIIGPVSHQARFHQDGELATARGASAAQAVMVISQASSVPIETLVAAATSPCWVQVFASDPTAAAHVRRGTTAGCQAVCITIGAAPTAATSRVVATAAPTDWTAVEAVKRGVKLPVIIKGITTPDAAREALRRDVQGLIVSNYGGLAGSGTGAPLLSLPAILDAVDGRVPVLVDGSVRRGTDVIKALAFGAKAVLVSRPVMWGLAAYGADGVQGVVEMLQTELARYMCMCGRPLLAALTPAMLQVHGDRPAEARPRG